MVDQEFLLAGGVGYRNGGNLAKPRRLDRTIRALFSMHDGRSTEELFSYIDANFSGKWHSTVVKTVRRWMELDEDGHAPCYVVREGYTKKKHPLTNKSVPVTRTYTIADGKICLGLPRVGDPSRKYPSLRARAFATEEIHVAGYFCEKDLPKHIVKKLKSQKSFVQPEPTSPNFVLLSTAGRTFFAAVHVITGVNYCQFTKRFLASGVFLDAVERVAIHPEVAKYLTEKQDPRVKTPTRRVDAARRSRAETYTLGGSRRWLNNLYVSAYVECDQHVLRSFLRRMTRIAYIRLQRAHRLSKKNQRRYAAQLPRGLQELIG